MKSPSCIARKNVRKHTTYSQERWKGMQLAENLEVYCDSPMFSGAGIIEGIFPEEFGVQVLLHEPDIDGHRLKRFSRSEIKPIESQKEEQPILSPGVKMIATAAGAPIRSVTPGEQYLIQVSTYSNNPLQVNIYDPQTERHLGGCNVNGFKDVKEFNKKEYHAKIRTKPDKKKKVNLEQLSFDF
jgi:hypothetical protein